ncbi:hypothetical protein FHW96_003863 [Novosphingobium sp. SG751A]|uniref:hypothetical protein n=1 Tax=Novosphingobium sp. SG751A TaxID=2587000 RepID=UPI0015564EA6|nr:hypothetical protein [Novosphingobium sp. SG751A]NOW47681.1 hypothetical protein [Novosphingobium sp. SG751A]
MIRTRLACLLALAAGVSCTVSGPSPAASRGWRPDSPRLGINLSMLGSPFPEIPFVDVFKQFDPWIIRGTAFRGKTTLANGWITELAEGQSAHACAFQRFNQGHYPAGLYTVLYDGRGELTARGSLRIVEDRPGRLLIDVTPSADPAKSGICLVENATAPDDPIRNIRVILPGFEQTYRRDPFYPPFLRALKPFGTIRFMPWAGIARSEVVEWADRRPADYATQALSFSPTTEPVTRTGVALEYQIALANRMGADPWLNVPVRASDDYIRQMATYVHAHLRPDLHLYIEFSNEIWNGRFASDYRYAREMGASMGLDSRRDQANAGLYWYALRATQMFDIWNAVYGRDARKIAHVIAGQQNWPREAEIILSYRDTYRRADVLAVGGYVSPYPYRDMAKPETAAQIATHTPAQVLDSLNTAIAASGASIAIHRDIARRYGLGMVVYEGGTDFETGMVPNASRAKIDALFAAAQADPQIGPAYRRLLDIQFAQGTTLFNHFCDVMPPAAGGHGLLNWQDQPLATSVKYQVLSGYFARKR